MKRVFNQNDCYAAPDVVCVEILPEAGFAMSGYSTVPGAEEDDSYDF